MSFLKNIGKNIGKISSKNLCSNYNEKLLDHAKDELKTASKNMTQETAESIGVLIDKKITTK